MLADYDISPALPASDIARARAFYENLGFQPEMVTPDGSTFYRSGSVGFEVYPSGFAGTNEATAAGWQVTDFDAVITELRANGVKFEDYDFGELKTVDGVAELPDGTKAAWFKDTEGNILGVFQPGS